MKNETLAQQLMNQIIQTHNQALTQNNKSLETKMANFFHLMIAEYQLALSQKKTPQIKSFHKARLTYPKFKNPLEMQTSEEELQMQIKSLAKA